MTGVDLATHCRLLLHDRPRNRRLVRYAVLYPLYILCEIAIVCTDLAELLGSAIALCMLIPKLPLWAGVALTAADVLVFLVVGGPSRYGKPARMFEVTIMLLVRVAYHDPPLGLMCSTGPCSVRLLHLVDSQSPSGLAAGIPGFRSVCETV